MGGRGAKSSVSSGKVIPFRKPGELIEKTSGGWNTPGEVERVDRLIDAANKAKTTNQIQQAAIALKRQDDHLSRLIETAREDGNDVNVLITQRRRVRQQRKKTVL